MNINSKYSVSHICGHGRRFLLILSLMLLISATTSAIPLTDATSDEPVNDTTIDTTTAPPTIPTDTTVVDSTVTDSASVDTTIILVPVDTVLFQPGNTLKQVSLVSDTINFESRLTQNPTGGLLKSLLIPGWGQVGNKKYIKALFFFGVDLWMVGSAIHYGRQASDYRKLYEATPLDNITLRNDYHGLYDDRKDERNKCTWFAVITTFIAMFDAYVDAHLSGYPGIPEEDDDKIKIRIVPKEDQGIEAGISFSF